MTTGAVVSPLLAGHVRLWPTVLVSLAAHAAVVALAVWHRPDPIINLDQKPIVARLVRLGEKKPEAYLPRKDAAAEAAAPAPVPLPGGPPPPAPGKAAQAPRPPTPAAASPKPRRDALASVLDRFRRDRALGSPRYGDASGDPSGDAEEATEGDRYLGLVTRAIESNYTLPATLQSERLEAIVVLVIEPDGGISGYRFEKKSGRPAFDDALERAIRRTRLPPPPPELRDQYRRIGLGVRFGS